MDFTFGSPDCPGARTKHQVCSVSARVQFYQSLGTMPVDLHSDTATDIEKHVGDVG